MHVPPHHLAPTCECSSPLRSSKGRHRTPRTSRASLPRWTGVPWLGPGATGLSGGSHMTAPCGQGASMVKKLRHHIWRFSNDITELEDSFSKQVSIPEKGLSSPSPCSGYYYNLLPVLQRKLPNKLLFSKRTINSYHLSRDREGDEKDWQEKLYCSNKQVLSLEHEPLSDQGLTMLAPTLYQVLYMPQK